MSLFVLFVLMVLALQLPALVPNVMGIPAHAPDLFVLTVVYLALRAPGYRSVGWAVAIGIVRDAVSLDPLGTNAFVLGFVAFIFCEGTRRRGRILGLQRLVFVGLATILAGWTYLVRTLPLGGGWGGIGPFVDVLPVALWTVLLASALYPLFDRFRLLDDICGRDRRGRSRALPA